VPRCHIKKINLKQTAMKKINLKQTALSVVIATLLVSSVYAAENDNQPLIDDMRRLLDQAERDRSANARFLKQARDMLSSYELPWHLSVLDENFSDGDYTRNPAWIVDAGQFQVARGVGLRSQVPVQAARAPASRQDTPRDAVSQILEILRQGSPQQPTQQQAPAAPTVSAIHTVVPIPNSFQIEVDVSVEPGGSDSSFSFGPYQGERRDTGYQLVYRGGAQPIIELHRLTSGRNAIVEIYDNLPIPDDHLHTLTWQRRNDGTMSVLLDGSELFATSDRGLRDPFTGFSLLNETGGFAFSRVRIDGEAK
jgi:hypothetical protein